MVIHPGDHGSHVLALQRLLKRNRWGTAFYRGRLDGEYGPQTHHAILEARYQLGYPKRRVNAAAAGDLLVRLLEPLEHGGKRLNHAWAARRKKRLALLRHVLPLRLRRYRVAQRHVGYHEGAGNSTIFGRWYGLPGQPWCAMFWTYCDAMAGGTFRYAYTPLISENATAGRYGLHRTWSPKRGDGVTYDWEMRHSVSGTDHVGIFDRWIDQRHGVFATIEGNTGPQSGSGPEGVYRRTRTTSEVVVFFTAD